MDKPKELYDAIINNEQFKKDREIRIEEMRKHAKFAKEKVDLALQKAEWLKDKKLKGRETNKENSKANHNKLSDLLNKFKK